MSSNAVGLDGKIYCRHGEEAAKRKSSNPIRPNREYYCCKRPPGDPARCKFHLWANEIEVQDQKPIAIELGGPGPRGLRPTPICRPLTNKPETQNKKRLDDVKAGLRQRDQDLSPTGHLGSKEPGPSVPLIVGRETTPSPPSPVPTETDDEAEVQPQETYNSFLGLDWPDTSITDLGVGGQPSASGEQHPTSPAKDTVAEPFIGAAPSGGGLVPRTPPRITQHFSRKGKGKECDAWPPGDRTQDQVGLAQYDPHEIQEEDALPSFTLPEDTFTMASASPTSAENVLDYVDGIKARVKALQEYMDSFDITQAAKLLQTDERQKMRYEYRDRCQKMRIGDLDVEVSRLKEELKVKDAEIAALKRLSSD